MLPTLRMCAYARNPGDQEGFTKKKRTVIVSSRLPEIVTLTIFRGGLKKFFQQCQRTSPMKPLPSQVHSFVSKISKWANLRCTTDSVTADSTIEQTFVVRRSILLSLPIEFPKDAALQFACSFTIMLLFFVVAVFE